MDTAREVMTFMDYQQHVEHFAWFKNTPNYQERKDTVFFGFNEEVDELLYDEIHPDEHVRMFWGQPVSQDVDLLISRRFESEVGDVLYYLTAAAMIHDVSLDTIAQSGLKNITDISESDVTDFATFDSLLRSHMMPPLDESYKPNYFARQFFGSPPFRDANDNLYRQKPFDNPCSGPLVLESDGLYALQHSLRTTSDFISSKNPELFVEHAGMALGALSIVSQNRFGSSLNKAANHNITKLERRTLNNTQQDGPDAERSRPSGQEREQLSGWDVTVAGLRLG